MKRIETICERGIENILRLMGVVPDGLADLKSRLWGLLWYALDRKHRNIVLENLATAFSETMSLPERHLLARNVMARLMGMFFDMGRYLRLSRQELETRFRVEGIENIRSALDRGRGVLALTAHFGTWELLPAAAALADLPVSIVYRPLDFAPLDRVIARLRTRFGSELIPSSRGAMRSILRALSRGRIVAMLMDQNVDWYEGVWVDFFGKPACTNKGMAVIARKTGAPVVPVFLLPDGNRRWKICFQPELPIAISRDKTIDIEANTALFTRVIEGMIRRYPDQWFWVHQRWKTANACLLPPNAGRTGP
ncbi:MAG: lysophospholipid acyltransferase family protein [Thermodesulfobacteriota bacterium]